MGGCCEVVQSLFDLIGSRITLRLLDSAAWVSAGLTSPRAMVSYEQANPAKSSRAETALATLVYMSAKCSACLSSTMPSDR